ncbi:MAG: HNH endonuclease [Sodalinema sp.]|uniref:HNH endonuclease signature motif containing protein n=1 Tax=Sodalinema sp. TaxID=3080550 RepID=UPI00396F3087
MIPRKWSEQEVQYLKDNYLSLTARQLAEDLNRGYDGVKKKMKTEIYDKNETLGVDALPGFRVVPASPLHAVNSEGIVLRIRTHKPIKPSLNKKGYLQVCLQGAKSYRIHRLVAELFIPNPEQKPQVNHIDGNKLNNSVENLEWVTNQENKDHAISNGLWDNISEKIAVRQKGAGNSSAKLSETDVLDIYERLRNGEPVGEIAKFYGVNHSNISAIKSGKSWGHLYHDYFKVQRPERDGS